MRSESVTGVTEQRALLTFKSHPRSPPPLIGRVQLNAAYSAAEADRQEPRAILEIVGCLWILRSASCAC